MNLIYADLRDWDPGYGRVDDNDERNGDGEREQRDEKRRAEICQETLKVG